MDHMNRRDFLQLSVSTLGATTLASVLAACGGSPATSGPTDLSIWLVPAYGTAGPPPANWEAYKVLREKLNINLKLTLLSGDDATTKLNAAASANDLPDFFGITDRQSFRQWVNLGLVAPVDSLLPEMPQRTKLRYSDPTTMKLGLINGKHYSLEDSTMMLKRTGLFIRKDWLDKLGLQPPATLDEFLEVAKAFTYNDPDGDKKKDTYGYGTTVSTTGLDLGPGFAFVYGAYGLPGPWNLNTSGKLSLSVRDPGYLQGTLFLRKLQEAKVIDPDWPTLTWIDLQTRWKQGKHGMFFNDFSATLHQDNYKPFDENFPNGELIPINPPKGPTGQSSLGTFAKSMYAWGVSQKAINAGKSPAIAKFLEWANAGEGYRLLAFGQEGKNYKMDAQGNVIDIKDVPVPSLSVENGPYVQMAGLAYNWSPAELKLFYYPHKTRNGRTIDPFQAYQQISGMPWQDATATLLIPPAANQADINRYITEHLVQFITGQKPLTTASWNDFIKGLDALNVAEWEATAEKTLKDAGLS